MLLSEEAFVLVESKDPPAAEAEVADEEPVAFCDDIKILKCKGPTSFLGRIMLWHEAHVFNKLFERQFCPIFW